jgi:hypothetical protein
MLDRLVRLGIYRCFVVRVRKRRPVRANVAASRRGVPDGLLAGMSDVHCGIATTPGTAQTNSRN